MTEIYTRTYAEEQLRSWLDAQAAVATGQAYTIGRRSLTRANLNEILKMISFWESKLENMGTPAPRTRRAVPRDI